MEYDSFRRGMFCYWAQMKTFNKLIRLYIVVVLVTSSVVSKIYKCYFRLLCFSNHLFLPWIKLFFFCYTKGCPSQCHKSTIPSICYKSLWKSTTISCRSISCCPILHGLTLYYAYWIIRNHNDGNCTICSAYDRKVQ